MEVHLGLRALKGSLLGRLLLGLHSAALAAPPLAAVLAPQTPPLAAAAPPAVPAPVAAPAPPAAAPPAAAAPAAAAPPAAAPAAWPSAAAAPPQTPPPCPRAAPTRTALHLRREGRRVGGEFAWEGMMVSGEWGGPDEAGGPHRAELGSTHRSTLPLCPRAPSQGNSHHKVKVLRVGHAPPSGRVALVTWLTCTPTPGPRLARVTARHGTVSTSSGSPLRPIPTTPYPCEQGAESPR